MATFLKKRHILIIGALLTSLCPLAAFAAGSSDSPLADSAIAKKKAPQKSHHKSPDPLARITPWIKVTVEKGDSLVRIFNRYNLDANQWQDILDLGDASKALTNLHPGDTFRLRKTPKGNLAALSFQQSPIKTLHIQRTEDGLKAFTTQLKTETKKVRVSGTIDGSISESLHDAGTPYKIINQLGQIFEWRRSLSRTVRPGDKFTIIYTAEFSNSKPINSGHIVAAALQNRSGGIDRAFRYTNKNGSTYYYDTHGKSYAPSILRTPLKFKYVSSSFNLHRKHPKLGIVRPHEGVDLAATKGTPIHAAADGYVRFIGRSRGYGNLIKLKHAKGYSTRYGHMNHFAKGLHKGDYVHQGEVIGYVGMTGLATGYHLHYEIRKNGIPHDPIHMKLPDSYRLDKTELAKFSIQIGPMLARLSHDSSKNPLLLARNQSNFASTCNTGNTLTTALGAQEKSSTAAALNQILCGQASITG